jgi:transposase InsO family protein
VGALCGRFGISRTTGYKWLARFDGERDSCRDQSRRPQTSPRRVGDACEAAVLAVREEHRAWGARKIGAVMQGEGLTVPAVSTIHAILARHGKIGVPPGGQPAHLRFERDQPNELVQMDFKGSSTLGNGEKLYPLTLVDDHSRYCLGIAACGDETGTSVKSVLEGVFRAHGLPQAFFVDNGNPWGDSQGGEWTKFRVWLLKLGVELIHARYKHPQSRGKNERFHRSMDDEIFAMRPLRDRHDAQRAFDHWRDIYNHKRPHEGIGMRRPAERYRPSPRTMPDRLPEVCYDEGETVRKLPLNKSVISFKGRDWNVPKAFQGELLAIRPHDTDGTFGIYFGANLIKTINLNTQPKSVNHVSEHV